MGTTYTRKPSQPVQYDIEDSDNLYITRMPSSARRYKPADTLNTSISQDVALVQRRRSNQTAQNTSSVPTTAIVIPRPRTEELPIVVKHRKNFPFIALFIGMLSTILLLICFAFFQSWWQGYQDDLNYGNPRTYHFDAVVGHNDSDANPTHFILTNLKGHIEIIEIPGGDTARIHAFNGPTLYGNGQDRIPVRGKIRIDNGKPDLVVQIGDQQVVYLNDGTTFHLA